MTTVQTIVRGISTTSEINFQINKHFNKLKRAYCKIKKCRVSIELAKNNTHKDKLYCVCISITIPGKQLISKKQEPNLFIAIRDGFLAIEQILEKNYKKKVFFKKSYSHYLRGANETINDSRQLIQCPIEGVGIA